MVGMVAPPPHPPRPHPLAQNRLCGVLWRFYFWTYNHPHRGERVQCAGHGRENGLRIGLVMGWVVCWRVRPRPQCGTMFIRVWHIGVGMSQQMMSGAVRIEEEYACPNCSSENLFSPTYKQRKCASCGHRGSETEFRTSKDADCPDCGDTAPKTHETENTNIYTCRGCYNQWQKSGAF